MIDPTFLEGIIKILFVFCPHQCRVDHFNPKPEFGIDRIHNPVFPCWLSLISPLPDGRERPAPATGGPDPGKQGNPDSLLYFQDRRK